MRKSKRTLKKHKFVGFLVILLSIITIGSGGYLLYSLSLLSGIEDKIRLLFSIDLVIILIGYIIALKKSFKKY